MSGSMIIQVSYLIWTLISFSSDFSNGACYGHDVNHLFHIKEGCVWQLLHISVYIEGMVGRFLSKNSSRPSIIICIQCVLQSPDSMVASIYFCTNILPILGSLQQWYQEICFYFVDINLNDSFLLSKWNSIRNDFDVFKISLFLSQKTLNFSITNSDFFIMSCRESQVFAMVVSSANLMISIFSI